MECRVCQSPDNRVASTVAKQGMIRRRRICDRCGHRWTTVEAEEALFVDRESILASLRSLEALVSPGG